MLSSEEEKTNLLQSQLYHLILSVEITGGVPYLEWNIGKDIDLNQRICGTELLKLYDPDSIGCTPLHLAYIKNAEKAFEILLNHNADFTMRNKNGLTIIHEVIRKFCVNSNNVWNFKGKLDNSYINSILSAHIKYGNFTNPCDDDGISHFHAACMSDNAKAAEFFLKNGIVVEQTVKKDSSILPGYTPLHIAARCASLEVVKILLKYGANMTSTETKGITPLHVLIEYQMSIDGIAESQAKLIDQIKWLFLEKELDGIYVDSIGFSNFHAACTMMDSSLVERLLEQIENINHCVNIDSPIWPSYTALHFAARCNLKIFQILVKKGANIKVKNFNKTTVFEACLDKCKADDVHDMLKSNPSWNTITLSDGETKLLDVVDAIKNPFNRKSINTMSNISDINIFVPAESNLWPGYTVLHLAVILLDDGTRYENFKQFLNRDADICALDARGFTPLQLAFRMKKNNFLVAMIECHSKTVNPIDEDGLSHLHIACMYGTTSLIERLLSTDPDVNNVYKGVSIGYIKQQSTAVHTIFRSGRCDALDLLLTRGADLYAKDVNDATPLHLLVGFKHENCFHDDLIARFQLLKTFHSRTGMSLLHIASHSHSAAEVEELLNLGENPNEIFIYEQKIKANDLNINISDYEFQSYLANLAYFRPLHFGVKSNCVEIVDLLISWGADLFIKAPKHYQIFSQKYIECLEYIVFTTTKSSTLERLRKDLNLTTLHVACYNIDVDTVRDELLKEAVDVNSQIYFNSPVWPGYTPLHLLLIVNRGYRQKIDDTCIKNINIIAELLIEAGADVTITDGNRSSPLHLAHFYSRDSELERSRVSKLLKSHKNFDVNPINVRGISHFYIACELGDADIVEKFLKSGVEVNEKSDIFFNDCPSPLHISVDECRFLGGTTILPLSLETIELLLKSGADVSAVNHNGDTPLHMLVSSPVSQYNPLRKSLVEKLIRYGSDVNAMNIRGETAFEIILNRHCSTQEFGLFVKHTNYLNIFNVLTKEGLIGQIFNNFNRKLFKMTLDVIRNTPQVAKMDEMGRTAIHNVLSLQKKSYSIMNKEFFLDLANIVGCDINDQDVQGQTALHYALVDKNTQLIPPLLEAGADPNIFNSSGNTALHIAVRYHNKTVISELLTAGADANATNAEGDAALHVAVRYNNANVITALLAAAPDANLVNTKGDSALHIAVKNNSSAALYVLLQSGVDLDIEDADGQTAFQTLLQLGCSADFDLRRTFAAHISKLKSSGFNLGELNIDLTP